MNTEIETTDGRMEDSAKALAEAVVGHRIVTVEKVTPKWESDLIVTLDNGHRVKMSAVNDCCAWAEVEAFLLHPEMVEHVITGVSTENDYETWHIYASLGDVLELTVGYSEGSGYYAYGFDIAVEELGQ